MQSSEEESVKGENETNTDTENQNQEVGGRQELSEESEGNRGRALGYYKIPNVKRQEEHDSKLCKRQKEPR